jgi:pyruvate ferredoxin oxidoreductase alpha subunit
VEIPDASSAAGFVGAYDPGSIRFRASQPLSQAVAVLGGGAYSYFRYETHLAARAALDAYDEIADRFAETFGRRHPAVEAYRMDDADYAFVMMGSFATKAQAAVDRLRDSGWKIGLVRPRLLRPYPNEAFAKLLGGLRGVAVIDQNLSMGAYGVLYTELTSALYGKSDAPPVVASYVGGLGGRDIGQTEFFGIANEIREAAETGQTLPPRLLYTETELREIRKLQAVAAVERHELKEQP